MPEDLTPNNDELNATLPKTGPGTADESDPPRPAAPPRSNESLHDDDLAHTASNEGDGTQAS